MSTLPDCCNDQVRWWVEASHGMRPKPSAWNALTLHPNDGHSPSSASRSRKRIKMVNYASAVFPQPSTSLEPYKSARQVRCPLTLEKFNRPPSLARYWGCWQRGHGPLLLQVYIGTSTLTWASHGPVLSANDLEAYFREGLSERHSLNHRPQACKLPCIPTNSLLPFIWHLPIQVLGPFLPGPFSLPSVFNASLSTRSSLSASRYAQAVPIIKVKNNRYSILVLC